MSRRLSRVLWLCVGLALAACAGGGAPPASRAQPVVTEELSFDGLHRVQHARFAGVWIKTGTDFSVYKRLLVLPAEIAYKRPPTRDRMAADNFALDDRQMRRLRKLLREVFTKELVDKGGWQIAEEPAPDALIVKGGLLDLVVHVPPPPPGGGMGSTFVSSYGEATLVVEFRDSRTREILGRVADRRLAEPSAGREFAQADLAAPADLRVFFGQWARSLREGLDAVRAQPR